MKWLLGLIAAALAGTSVAWWSLGFSSGGLGGPPPDAPQAGPLIVMPPPGITVQGIGYVEPVSEVRRLAFKVDGVVERCPVQVGDWVTHGAPLMALADDDARAAAAVAEQELAVAMAERDQVTAGAHRHQIAAAEHRVAMLAERVRHAEAHLGRIDKLQQSRAAAKAEYDQAQTELTQAQLTERQAAAELDDLREFVRPVDRALCDTAPGVTAGDFTATIAWGDGGATSSGAVSTAGDGTFTVVGSHTYAEEASDAKISVTIQQTGGTVVTVTSTATVGDATLSGTASPIAATEGASFSGTVATFTDADPAGAATDYTATIDWGDKTALTTVTGSAFTSAGGVFSVPSSHAYADDGTYTLTVIISDVGGASATVKPIATVGDAALRATAAPVAAIQDATFTGTVATFSDANAAGASGDFTATITWEDGSKTNGTVGTAAGGGFAVSGSHVFAKEGGNQPVSVVITDKGGSTVSVTSTATVSDAALSGTASSITATEGASFSGTVATFSDANPNGATGDYTAMIMWEDGSTTIGAVTTAAGGGFAVSGSHVFAEEGSNLPVSVVVVDKGGAVVTIASTATVGDAALNGTAATIAAGITVSGTVASFSDADTADTTSDYTVAIDWGDGQTGTGGIVAGAAAGQFNVTGNHSYGDGNPHTITVTVTHGTDQPLVIKSAEPGNPVPLSVVDDIYVIGAGTVTVAAGNGVLANDSASGALTVTTGTVAGANGGTFAFNADGSFTYTPPANFPGFDYAQYTAGDAQGDKGTAAVNVLSQTGGVVWKFFESVLNRNPDYGGLKYWINDFANGGKTGDIAVGFFESNELLNKIIGGYYEQYLGRTLDAAGLSYWEGVWHATGGPEGIKAGFAASPEFNRNAGDTPTGWLTALYQRILNRAPDPQGFQYWQQQLAAGESESNVALGFFDSLEAYKNDVTGWFNEYLGRTPNGAELTQYASEMAAGKTDRTIEQEITNLPEYGANPPASPAGTAARLPDYLPLSSAGGQRQAALAAKDALFSSLGG
ncbi:MAG TPA: DUF4214 domain-containing protein [Pirellulales bacterium]|nr:DUF4214 domain-containing protein [Pirellulales bacterium]